MTKPAFITFTGADEKTDIRQMVALADEYPIEWALLLSPDRQGFDSRFPPLEFIDAIVRTGQEGEHIAYREAGETGMFYAAHLCGAYCTAILAGEELPPEVQAVVEACGRVQFNIAGGKADPSVFRAWADRHHVDPILQCGETFPDDPRVSWLHDLSGGRGRESKAWPEQIGPFVGYAGGIGPDNISEVMEEIEGRAHDYWLDMESKVRLGELFDLRKVQAVCEGVYG